MSQVQPFLIGSEWTTGHGEPFESINPADGTLNRRVATASEADVDRAVQAAVRAQRDPSWRDMLPHKRAHILRRLADLIVANGEALARRQMSENGKCLAECQSQAAAAASAFNYFASICETMVSEVTPPRGNYLCMTVYEPIGVVAVITPWNSPLTIEAQKLGGALAAGNAIVLKTSEFTPTIGLEIGRLALEAGLPPGVLNVVTGHGAVTGAALVQHPDVRMISFTGGTATGKQIGKIAAQRVVPVVLELGGKSPHIVFADADIDKAVEGVAKGIFSSSGQSCIAGSRLFVERSIYADFLDKLVRRTQRFRVGMPESPDTDFAPLSSFLHRERIERYVALAKDEGGRVLVGGKRPDNPQLANGAFFEPTIIDGLTNSARACREEIFGPVLCSLPFENEEELVEQANDTALGLGCGVWTASYPKAWRIARAIDAGTVWVNTYKESSMAAAFGGFKESGIGREKGLYGIRTYQEAKTIYFSMS